jgi:hypothetical protein
MAPRRRSWQRSLTAAVTTSLNLPLAPHSKSHGTSSPLSTAVKGFFDITPHPKPDALKTGAEIAKYYDEVLLKDHTALGDLSGDQLAKEMDFRGMFQMPAVGFLDLGLRHSIHHRGQLSVYLRPAGGKVPAIYGESYDSKNK